MYGGMSGLMNQMKNKRLQKEIKNRIAFRRSLNNLETGERKLTKAAKEQKQHAIAAEKSGDHAAAVRFALEAKRLENQLRVTGDMKNTTVKIHSLSENARALTGMMKTVNNLAGASGMPGPADMIDAQIRMEVIRENTDMMMEASAETLDQLTETSGLTTDEAGEAALRDLMKAEQQERRKSILTETGKKLDALTRTRAID